MYPHGIILDYEIVAVMESSGTITRSTFTRTLNVSTSTLLSNDTQPGTYLVKVVLYIWYILAS